MTLPRLVLLNGAPGAGKSTVARRWADDHPLSLVLDIDTVRSLLGGWAADRTAAGLVARDLAVAMALTHLRAGCDVVVPQHLGRAEFIERLAETAREAGARFLEVVLDVDQDIGRQRFTARGHGVETAGATEAFDHLYARLVTLLAGRPDAVCVSSVDGDLEATYRAFADAVDNYG